MLSILASACFGLMAQEAPDLPTLLSQVRGANYIPSYAGTSVKIWKDYRGEVIDRELGYARRLGLNSLRVYLQYVVYEDDAARFIRRFRDFVGRCAEHRIRPFFVLFDSCFGDEPALDKADSPRWVNNPGFSRLGRDHWPGLERYVRDVTAPFDHSSVILGWDIMNEPMADFNHVTRAERDTIWDFVRHFCTFTRETDPRHPISVGHAVVEYIPKTLDLVDFASIHSYTADEEGFRKDLALARHFGKQAGKPLVVTECGNPGAGQTYEMVLDVLQKERIGFYFWELMIGKIMFREMAGLVYPDGTVRDLSAAAMLVGFERKKEGVPLKTPPDRTALRAFLASPDKWPAFFERARKAPRTRKGVTPLVSPLVGLGRQEARPRPEAMEAFELGLSIGHLFRLGRDPEALKLYERLLTIAREAAIK